MVFGRMYSSRILPSAVNEFDSSDWLIRIYHGVDSIIRQESGGLHQSAVAPHIYQDKCQILLPCLLSEHPFPALQMFTSENLIMGY